jgi:bifunctional non-homologous end joining protein LigD
VQLYAFDALMLDGDDLRKLPIAMRKTNLARLLARRPDGIFISDFEQGEIGPDLFCKACQFGLEGLVSKHRDRAYRAGASANWIKVKNPKHPAMARVMEAVRDRSQRRPMRRFEPAGSISSDGRTWSTQGAVVPSSIIY